MNGVLRPWRVLLAIPPGPINERLRRLIEFQNSPIMPLMPSQGKKCTRLNTTKRARSFTRIEVVSIKPSFPKTHGDNSNGFARGYF